MSEYISFSDINRYGNDFFDEDNNPLPEEEWPYPPETVEAAEFFNKMDSEGGIDGLYRYGGAEIFPNELRSLVEYYGRALEILQDALEAWGKQRGVVY